MLPRAVSELGKSLGRNGPRKTLSILRQMCYRGLWFTFTSRYPLGTNVYEREWDALLVLDACRVDALRAVADEFDFIEHVDSIWSVGSHSHEWMCQTFTTDRLPEINRTTYVVGNGFAQRTFYDQELPFRSVNPLVRSAFDVADAADFHLLDGVWTHGHDDRLGNVPPRYITDRAIKLARQEDPERLIIHYNQPHIPHMAAAIDSDRPLTEAESEPFSLLKEGDLDRKAAMASYLDNLRLVLGEVELLLENLDADTVAISADHGEAFGEWGQYSHPRGSINPVIKKVPWAETTATDTGLHTPTSEKRDVEMDLGAHLADLGYRV
jgi:hypothetical protein